MNKILPFLRRHSFFLGVVVGAAIVDVAAYIYIVSAAKAVSFEAGKCGDKIDAVQEQCLRWMDEYCWFGHRT